MRDNSFIGTTILFEKYRDKKNIIEIKKIKKFVNIIDCVAPSKSINTIGLSIITTPYTLSSFKIGLAKIVMKLSS